MVLTLDQLASVYGGAGLSTLWNLAKNPPKSGSTGSGPMTLMDLADKPGKTLDGIKGMLGMPDTCAPNSTYTPAKSNGDGSITPGSCTNADVGGPSVPISQ
jgi:hypothetical protein